MRLLPSLVLFQSLTTAQLLVPLVAHPNHDLPLPAPRPDSSDSQQVLPIMPPSPPETTQQPAVALTDVLGTQRALTSFASFARLHDSTTTLLADLALNTTVLAPLNSAIEALPRKPWEDPRDSAGAYDGEDGQDRARDNLRRFVEAHLVGVSPWAEGEHAKTVGGREVWWESRGGKRLVMPDGVEVERVASQVANGELWIIKGVLNYV